MEQWIILGVLLALMIGNVLLLRKVSGTSGGAMAHDSHDAEHTDSALDVYGRPIQPARKP
jgi:hypothetical protein